jgi:hypothetical protein
MNKIDTFQSFLTNQSVQVDIPNFLVSLLLAALLAFLLGRIYIRWGESLSNRRLLAGNFVLIAVTTTLIITVVKSSLALSLGLVGALSIVRFRAAIKEPEELAYLFLVIAIGLGLGADQRGLTLVAFAVVAALIWLKHFAKRAHETQNLYLSVDSRHPEKVRLDQIIGVLKQHCSTVDMKRFDETTDALEAGFLVEFDDFNQLDQAKRDLQTLNEHLTIRFLDLKGLNP